MPVWVTKAAVIALHERQIREHGGSDGIRDEGLLDSALGRPRNLEAYGEPDLADLAASYAFGIARNHPFVDGNKRTSLVTAGMFLILNGHELTMPEPEAVTVWLALAAGDLSEAELAERIRLNAKASG